MLHPKQRATMPLAAWRLLEFSRVLQTIELLTAGRDGLLYPPLGSSSAPFVLFDVRAVPSGSKC
jgi:hypothetical protein